MADLPLFPFTSQEDWYGELVFTSADSGSPVDLTGRVFEMPITPSVQGVSGAVDPVRTLTMATGGGLSLKAGGTNTIVFRVPLTTARAFTRAEYTADILEVVDGERHVFMPVRIQYNDLSGLRSYISRFVGVSVTFAPRIQPIVTPLAIAGRQGAPGATIITSTVPPVPADGKDGDFFIEDRTAANAGRRMYGPKAGGAWPPTPWTIQVVRYQDVPGLSDALGGKVSKGDGITAIDGLSDRLSGIDTAVGGRVAKADGIGGVAGLTDRFSGIDTAVGGKVATLGFAATVASAKPVPTSWPELVRGLGDALDDVALSSAGLRTLPGAVMRAAVTTANDGSGPLTVHLYGNSRTYGLKTTGATTSTQSYRHPGVAIQEALRLVYPNAVVSNLGLPGKNMKEVFAALQTNAAGGNLPRAIILDAEAINGGTANPITVQDQQAALIAFIKLCVRKGVALIVAQSPINSQPTAQSVSALARMNLQVCRAYGIPTLDVDRQIGFGLDRYDASNSYDFGFHDSDKGYNRRFDDAALLMPTAGGPNGPRQVAPGTRLTFWDLGSHPGLTLVGDPSAQDGYSGVIKAGTSAVIALECLADVLPVVHCVWGNPTGSARPITMPFQGGQSGMPDATGLHYGAGVFRWFNGPRLPSGFRLLVIKATTTDLNVEAIEFIEPARAVVVAGGRSRATQMPEGPPLGLAGFVPATAYDFGAPALRANGFLAFDRARLPPLPVEYGLHLVSVPVQTADYVVDTATPANTKPLLADGMLVTRRGDALNLRSVYQGAVAADLLTAGVFAGYVGGALRLELTGGNLNVLVNGSLAGTVGCTATALYRGVIGFGDAPGVSLGIGRTGRL